MPHLNDAARLRGARDVSPESDVPVRFARREASLSPSALCPVIDTERLVRELYRFFEERIPDDVRDIEVSVTSDGGVVLHGLVSSPLARLLAEDLVYSLPEVWECHNELVVRTPASAA